MTEDAREKLHKFAHELADQLGRNGAGFISETNAAETIEVAILAAYPQIAPVPDGEAQKAARRIMALYATLPANAESAEDCAALGRDALTVCSYILSLAPTEDVVEAANKIASEWLDDEMADEGDLTRSIAAALTAHAAREREACAEIARLAPGQDWSDGTTPAEMASFIEQTIRARKP